jgi:hypothetical protein
MTASIELVELVDPWMFGVLSGDSTLNSLVGGRIEGDLGPITPDMPLPKVRFETVSSRDIVEVGGDIMDTDSLYDVMAIGLGDSYSSITPIAVRIHELLHRQAHTFPGGGSLTCKRERIIKHPDVVQGQTYRYLGGTYRIRCSKD